MQNISSDLSKMPAIATPAPIRPNTAPVMKPKRRPNRPMKSEAGMVITAVPRMTMKNLF